MQGSPALHSRNASVGAKPNALKRLTDCSSSLASWSRPVRPVPRLLSETGLTARGLIFFLTCGNSPGNLFGADVQILPLNETCLINADRMVGVQYLPLIGLTGPRNFSLAGLERRGGRTSFSTVTFVSGIRSS